MPQPIRVLHIIDHLFSGGSERLLWDLVRLSDPARVVHRVATVLPHDADHVFAERFRAVGAYDIPPAPTAAHGSADRVEPPRLRIGQALRRARQLATPALRRLPVGWKHPMWLAEDLLASLPTCKRLLAEVAEFSPDVLHAHVVLSFRFGLMLHFLTARPLVHTVQANLAGIMAYRGDRLVWEYRSFQDSIRRWFIAEPYVEDLRSLGIPSSRIAPLRGVTDVAAARQARAEAEAHRREVLRELGLPGDTLLALSVGRLHPLKGHEHAIDALPLLVKDFPNLHWIALGHSADKKPEFYHERARALGVGAHAHVLGFRDEPLPYYAASDVYLRTTTLEADNLSSYSAMAVGLPVVGFDSGCATELLPKVRHGLLVKNADPAALAEGIRQILSLPDRGRAMGARGIEYAARELDLASSIEEFVGSYERLVDR